MTGIVELAHWCFLGSTPKLGLSLAISVAWCLGLIALTLALFSRVERTACDRL
jgi:hypothetical protein